MKKYLQSILLTTVFFIYGNAYSAQDADLLSVFQQAVENDPTYQSVNANRLSIQENVPISRANLLPNVTGAANTTWNKVNIDIPGTPSVQDGFVVAGDNSFNSHGYSLNITQPIFDFTYWMQLNSAFATSREADFTYGAGLQDLIVRVASAYFGVLQAEDTLRNTVAQKKANLESLQQIKARYEAGLDTMTDVYQAQASYDALVAAEISATNNIVNSMETLRQITGQTYNYLAPVKDKLPLITPAPNDAEQWVHISEQHNLSLLAAREEMAAKNADIKVEFAGHLPVVNAVGTFEHTVGPSTQLGINVPNETLTEETAGVQVAVPIFQGGAVTALTQQAEYNYVYSSDQMEIIHRQVIANARESFNNITASISKIQADRLAILSNQSALQSIQAGYEAGTKTVLDILTAQQNVFQSQSTYSQDVYTYLNSLIALKDAAGTLSPNDVMEMNSWLSHT